MLGRLVVLCAVCALSIPALARASDEATRREIEATKAYINSHLPATPVELPGPPEHYQKPDIRSSMGKISGVQDRKSYFMNGNKIAVELYNYGGIAPGYGLLRGVNNLVWRNLDYVFQFCPIVAASVPDSQRHDQEALDRLRCDLGLSQPSRGQPHGRHALDVATAPRFCRSRPGPYGLQPGSRR